MRVPTSLTGEATPIASPVRSASIPKERRHRNTGATRPTINLFYIPALLLFIGLVAYPLFRGLWVSTTNWNGYSATYRVTGLANYARLFTDPHVLSAFINTIVYGCGSTLLQNLIGLGFALLLNSKFRGRTIGRTLIYLPVMIAPLIMGYIMYFFFRFENGALNDVVGLFGHAPVDWLGNGPRAVVLITLTNTLQFVGVSMVIYLAGLQAIPAMYSEAAALDGANQWQQFWHVTLPLLIPAITSSIMINLIGGLKLFDVVMALVGGQYPTNSLSTLINRTYFTTQEAGYASAIGVVLFVFIMVISAFAQRFLTSREVEQ